MSSRNETGSVTKWLCELNGDEQAKLRAHQELWDRYFSRLAGLARSRMPGDTRRAANEEDVALSALDSFFRRARDGEFPNLTDRTGLWPLLARITAFKAIQRVEHERAARRGGNRIVYESDGPRQGNEALPRLQEIVSSEPTPDFAAQMDDNVQHLLSQLDEDVLVRIAKLKLEGYQNTEIAKQLRVGLRTVERKLARIRTLWTEMVSGCVD